jgi:hypothetical protein
MVKNDKAADSTKQDSDPSEIKNDADKTMDTDVLDTHQEEKNHPAESGDEFIAFRSPPYLKPFPKSPKFWRYSYSSRCFHSLRIRR